MFSSKQIIDYYDKTKSDYDFALGLKKNMAMHYGFWDRTVHSFSGALDRENFVLANKVKPKRDSVVLDAGCGVGGSSIYLAKHYGCKVVGITLSQKQVQLARKNAKNASLDHKIKFFKMDYSKTVFKNGSFDIVWAIESICHAPDKNKFIKEAYRLLKKGGRLIVADGFKSSNKLSKNDDRSMSKWLNGWRVSLLETVENFKHYLVVAGFKDVSFVNTYKNILPSAIRIYFFSLLGLSLGRILQLVGLRNDTQINNNNIVACYFQLPLLLKKCWEYGYFYAKK